MNYNQNIKIDNAVQADYFLRQPINDLFNNYEIMGTTYEFDGKMVCLINSGA